MSRYGSVTISGPTSLITRVVQSADAADLQLLASAAIAALPAGYVVTNITLSGAGDGATFTVTIDAGLSADVTGGFVTPPTVECFLGSDASALARARVLASPLSGVFADTQVAGASKGTRFMGMVVKGVLASGSVAPPFVNLVYVDYNTTVPLAERNGSTDAPYGTVQAAVDAGHLAIYLTGGFINESVTVPPGSSTFYLTGANTSATLNALTLPDGIFAELTTVQIISLVGGNGCFVRANTGIGGASFGNSTILITSATIGGPATFGTDSILVTNGPGAVSFPAKVALCQLDNLTFGARGLLVATNTVFSNGATVTCESVEMYGCSSGSSMSAASINAQNCTLIEGTYTTTGAVDLQDVKTSGGVAFDNGAAAFQVDGFTNYWLKTNAIALTTPGAKVITEDLTP
jgi:hypothetical protein